MSADLRVEFEHDLKDSLQYYIIEQNREIDTDLIIDILKNLEEKGYTIKIGWDPEG